MKVSVLVPVYGVEKYIERCAVSLFEQTHRDMEYVFVNDCTPDRSISILRSVIERYPDRAPQVRIIDNEVNRGVGATRGHCCRNRRMYHACRQRRLYAPAGCRAVVRRDGAQRC